MNLSQSCLFYYIENRKALTERAHTTPSLLFYLVVYCAVAVCYDCCCVRESFDVDLRLSLERAIALGLVLVDEHERLGDEMGVVEQTYSIGAVRDPVSGEFISPREAVERGLLDMARGVYIYSQLEEPITLAEALVRGLIRAEPLQGLIC